MTLFVKWYVDALGDKKLLRATRNGAKYLVLLPWLLLAAKEADDEGRLTVDGDPLTVDDLEHEIPWPAETRRAAIADGLRELEACGVLVRDDARADVLRFAAWEKRASKPSDHPKTVLDRVHRHRAKKRATKAKHATNGASSEGVTPVTPETVTPRNAGGALQCNATEKEKEQEQRVKRKRKSPSARRAAGGAAETSAGTASSTPSGTSIDTPSAAAWTTEAGADWIAARKGTAPFGRIGAALLPLVERDGWSAIRPAWQRFVASPRARFGPEHFAANLQDFLATSPASLAAADSDWQVASDLWSLYDTAALTHERERSDWMQRGDELVAEGRYPSVDAFLAELRVTKPWTLGRCRTDEEAIAAIKKRIATQRSVVAAQVVASRQAGAA